MVLVKYSMLTILKNLLLTVLSAGDARHSDSSASNMNNLKAYKALIKNGENSPSGHIFQCISADCCDTNTGQDHVQSRNGHTL
jgi:hypothetical protein